ncbi:osmotically inducible protein OsmC [Parenemella sanctibonifatiensis]|uniref:Osmotically inducible protein OsmC n=1 Tax=Parenemella sanctibonifatiensis TaxID=2016505 RepID=A0A255EMR4_9ACTN|nr:osmotically inducible protein OsmC [Parenemella sanctibonifatiensis]
MGVTELRALQRPLKDGYRDHPESAQVTSVAEARGGRDSITATVESWAVPIRAGFHKAVGGDGVDACSGDILLQGLASCAGGTLASVATPMRIELRAATVRATGHWDARGTLGLDKSVPVGFTAIDLSFDLDTDADDQSVARLLELTERYCVVAQTLRQPPEITISRA